MPTSTDQMGHKVQMPAHPKRIISLVPSQTELLYDLGLGQRVVGITKFCVHPETWFKTKTRVGGTKQFDLRKIRELAPDLIIANKEENRKEDIEALAKEFPVWISDVRDLPSALDMITMVGALTGTIEKADVLRNQIADRFATLKPLEPFATVAYFIWREPYMVAGHGTFINDMLERCGLINVFDSDDARYPEITAKEVEEAAPDLILLSSEPYPFKEKHIEELLEICPQTPVRLVDGEFFSWYGSRLLGTVEYLNGMLRG